MFARSLPRLMLGSLLAMAAALPAAWAQQTYPQRQVRVVVGFGASGGIDIMARVFAQQLAERLGGSFVVENRPGASGNIASGLVARAPADGHTLLMIPIAFAINPAFAVPADFDPIADFAPVTMIAVAPNVIVVPRELPAANLREFVAYAKSVPQKVNYASSGPGSATHLAGLLFAQVAGVDMVHVPYKGGGQALAAVMSGEVAMYVASMPAAIGLIRTNRVKALATTSTARASAAQDIPTAIESGLPYEYNGWYGMLAPRDTPRPIIDRLRGAIVESLKTKTVLERLAADGAEPAGTTPEEFRAFLVAQIDAMKKVARAAGPEKR